MSSIEIPLMSGKKSSLEITSQVYTAPDATRFTLENVSLILDERPGGTAQYRATLKKVDSSETVQVILKQFRNINQAVVHSRMVQEKDALKDYIPSFYGAFLEDGFRSNFSQKETGETFGYIILKDLSEGNKKASLKDFKFARPILLKNDEVKVKHDSKERDSLTTRLSAHFIYKFFAYSSFLITPSRKPNRDVSKKRSYDLKNRIQTILKTGKTLRREFKSLSLSELKKTTTELKTLKSSMEKSSFAFVDSSLLFISKKEKGRKTLSIRLIDMNHAFHQSENLTSFEKTKKAGVKSLESLIALAERIQQRKELNQSLASSRTTEKRFFSWGLV